MNVAESNVRATLLCGLSDLIEGGGVAALIGNEQVALFYLPDPPAPSIFALGNFDPIGQANVLARGIVGDVDGEPVVASPLYKQHFSLKTGACLEDPGVSIPTYRVLVADGHVFLIG